MARLKFEVNPGLLMPLSDRFSGTGYKEPIDTDKAFSIIAGMKEAEGIGFWGPGQVTLENAAQMAQKVRSAGKEPAVIVMNTWDKEWKWGTFSNKSAEIREKAVETAKECVDIASVMGIKTVTMWLAHDGVDYAFQADYSKVWDWMADGLTKVADHNPDINIAVEYKIREPRIHQFVGNLGDTLCMVKDVNRPNVGVTLDLGHAINAGERIAYSAVRLLECGKLFNMHWGDNYRLWDDDVVVGTVNTIEFIEVVYWLHKYNWQGWCALDQYPFKNNAYDAMTESILWVRGFEKVIDRIGIGALDQAIQSDEPKRALKLLREAMLDIK